MAAGQSKPKKKGRLNIGEKQGYTSNLTGERTPASSGSPAISGASAPSWLLSKATGSGDAGSGKTTLPVTPPGTGGSYNTGSGGTQTAFGDRFLPGMYDTAYANPEAVLREYFNMKGMNTQGGTYAAMRSQANNMPLAWLLAQGGDAVQGTPNYLDWTGQYYNQALTPGGASLSNRDIANALTGAAGDSTSILGNALTTGATPDQQVGDFMSTLRAGMDIANIPDIVKAAYLAQAGDMGDSYMANALTDPNNQAFLQQIIQSGLIDRLGR